MTACKECGSPVKLNYNPETNADLSSRSLCFTCNFWYECTQKVDDPSSVRVQENDGMVSHYWIGHEPDPGCPTDFLGFGGARFVVTFHDGRTVKTRNLWYQGRIPDIWKSRLPVNADLQHGGY